MQYGIPGAATAGDYGPPLPLDEIVSVLLTLLMPPPDSLRG